jgi:hypothetical protein
MMTPVIVSRPTHRNANISSGSIVFIFSPLLVHLQIRYDGINVKRTLHINFSRSAAFAAADWCPAPEGLVQDSRVALDTGMGAWVEKGK